MLSDMQVQLCLMHQPTAQSEAQEYLVQRTVRSTSSVWHFQGPDDNEQHLLTWVTICKATFPLLATNHSGHARMFADSVGSDLSAAPSPAHRRAVHR